MLVHFDTGDCFFYSITCLYKNKYVYLYKQKKDNMRTTNYSELRNNLKNYLDGVINDSEPLIVHRSGSESVVVISLEEYNSIKETEYLMKSPETMAAILQGEKDIETGNSITQQEGESVDEFLNRVSCTE